MKVLGGLLSRTFLESNDMRKAFGLHLAVGFDNSSLDAIEEYFIQLHGMYDER